MPADLEHVDPVAVLAQVRRAERVVVPVQVQARQLDQLRARLELGVGLARVDLDVVAERGKFAGHMPQVDALAAAMRLAAVGEQADAERARSRGSDCWCGAHAGSRLLVRHWLPTTGDPRDPPQAANITKRLTCVPLRPTRKPPACSSRRPVLRRAVSVSCRDEGFTRRLP